MLPVDMRLAAANALQHLARVLDGPSQPLAQVFADPCELRVGLVGWQRVSDNEATAVQTGNQSVRALRLHHRVSVVARNEDEIARRDRGFHDGCRPWQE